MATAEGLMGLGQPAELAKRTGTAIVLVTTSASPTLLRGAGNKTVLVTVTLADQDLLLPADADLGDVVEIINGSAVQLEIFPHSGGSINNGAPNAVLALAGNATTAKASHVLRKVSATHWRSVG